MTSNGPRMNLRVAAAATAGIMALGLATGARADEKASRACRGAIAKSTTALSKTALKFIDSCHKGQDKLGLATGPCNLITPGVSPFDPKIKYAAGRTKLGAGVGDKCLAADPVLLNYPTSNVVADVFPIIEDQAGGNTTLTVGGANSALDKAKIKCTEGIAKARAAIFAEIAKESTKCQATLDKTAVTFSGLDPTCVRTAVKAAPKYTASIQKDCVDTALTNLGTCGPLPTCVIDSATNAAQISVSSTYQLGFGTCGNNVLEDPEQCDDGNTTSGDGCSDACEKEGAATTCSAYPGNTVLGPRTATISISIPGSQKLAGLQIDFDYPQLQSGIAGTGGSSIVGSNITLLQDTTPAGNYLNINNDRETDARIVVASGQEFIDDGNVVSIAMDACQPMALNLCNRNQNIMGCCNATTDVDGDTIFQECTDPDAPPICAAGSFSTTQVGAPTVPPALEDCCPADNACVTQTAATTCTASGAKASGEPVDGITCTVTLSGN